MPSRARPPSWELADGLHSAAIHLLRRARRTDPLTGVSAAALSALSVLMGGPKTLGELAQAEQVRAPTMSRLVKAMARAGVVRRESDPTDARVVRIRATAKGLRTLERGRAMRIATIARLVDGLGVEDRETLARAAALVEHALGQRAAPWRTAASATR